MSDKIDFVLYRYTPSLVAAVIAVIVFAFLTIAHLVRLLRSRTYYFVPFLIGGILETLGYCGRIWGHYNTTAIGGYIIQSLFILIAPALFAASIYMILGRLIHTLRADHISVIPLRFLTKIFVTGDIIAFTLQLGGGGLQAAGTLQLFNTGRNIILAGLFVQIIFFGVFVGTAVLFNIRYAKVRREHASQKHMNVLYITSGLILVRSIFRVVEYLQGNDGYLMSHEVFLYIFDGLLMAMTMAILLIWYVDHLIPIKQEQSSNGKIGV